MRVQFEQRPQKSGRPPVTGCSRQFIARASIRASVYLPDPLRARKDDRVRKAIAGQHLAQAMDNFRVAVEIGKRT